MARFCLKQGCSAIVERGYCAAHAKAKEVARDSWRGSAASRGYDSRWRRYSERFRQAYPTCGDRPEGAPMTRDSQCRVEQRVEPSTVVDHIVPVSGPTDPRFYDETNHQALCERCHNVKRQRERGW